MSVLGIVSMALSTYLLFGVLGPLVWLFGTPLGRVRQDPARSDKVFVLATLQRREPTKRNPGFLLWGKHSYLL